MSVVKCAQSIGRFCLCMVPLSLVHIFYTIRRGKAIFHSSSEHILARKARHHLIHVHFKASIESGNLQSYDEQRSQN